MRRLLFFFLILSTLYANEAVEVLPFFHRTPSPSQLIGGLVHPLNGSLSLSEQDLVIKGAQEISLQRIYFAPYMPYSFDGHWDCDLYQRIHYLRQNYEGWKIFPHLSLWRDHKKSKIYLTTPQGANYTFELIESSYQLIDSYAICNMGGDEVPSSQYDPRNIQIQAEGHKIIASFPDGSQRIYHQKKAHSLRFLLQKEILPNGKILKYHYIHHQLSRIESCDPEERHIYAFLDINGSPEEGRVSIDSSTKQKCNYTYESRYYKGSFRHHGEKIEYHELSPPLLIKASTPNYREEKLHYTDHYHLLDALYGKEKHFCLSSSPFGENAHFRIDKLYFPVGIKDAATLCHELSYKPALAGEREGETLVKNYDGTSTLYHFSKELLITSIQYFGKEGALEKEKIFTWNYKQWLSSIELRDGKQKLFYRKSYEYDSFGNPILEKFTGDLQGNGVIESTFIKREFSQEGRNLLLKEESEEGIVTTYTYLPNTNLLIKKVALGFCEKYLYDSCHNLIMKSVEDEYGSKRITEYKLRQKEPFLHMPEWIEERYVEEGIEKLLRRIHLDYDGYGNVCKEDFYNDQNQYVYTLKKKYDEQGNLLSETTALGVTKSFTYDGRGRCIKESSSRKSIEREFDLRGRVVEECMTGNDGIVQITKYRYQKEDQPSEVIDSFGNHSFYTYDPLTHQVTSSTLPSITTCKGERLAVSTHSTYDALGRKLSYSDAKGMTLFYRYNAYGAPVDVLYPEGTKECSRYSKNGKLLSYKDRDGLLTTYKYDLFGRMLSEKRNEAKKDFLYQGAHLVGESDFEGNRTSYFYDGAGRKIEEEKSGRRVFFTYDALGFLATIQQGGVITHFKRDFEGKVLEETKSDRQGKILHKIVYGYTSEGEVSRVVRFIEGKEAVESFTYDSLGRKIESKDSLGSKSTISYDEEINVLGERVLEVTSEDPQGVLTKELYDPYHRVVQTERSLEGKVLSSSQNFYDVQGNLNDWIEKIYQEGNYLGVQRTHFDYTKEHRLKTVTRAFGTSLARTTSYDYTPGGKIAKKTLPNGVILTYEYHPLGYLQRLSSSNGKIDHRFQCNRKGELIEAYDGSLKMAIRREVDPFGNVIREYFPYITIEREYDELDRMKKLSILRIGSVTYEYNPCYLTHISRLSPEGKVLYSHQYEKYDLDGNVLTERMIYEEGEIKHKYDGKGRLIASHAPYFSQKCKYDCVGNLIEILSDRSISLEYDGLSQLTSENERSYGYDSLLNRRGKNDRTFSPNTLNELEDFSYDLCGNQLGKEGVKYKYDVLNRLIEAKTEEATIFFQYDPLGRRMQKVVKKNGVEVDRENYLYIGQDEIGALNGKGKVRNFRILGRALHEKMPQTVAIELEGKAYAPIMDLQGNICKLVEPHTKKVSSYSFTAFGEELVREEERNPWRYASKRTDDELSLIYFGKRYYDPSLGRWLTPDPSGFVDGMNLYQYSLNNPYSYYDPNGEFAFLACIPFALIFTPAVVKICTDAVLVGLSCWAAYEGVHYGASVTGISNSWADIGKEMITTSFGGAGLAWEYMKLDRSTKEHREKNYPGSAKDLEKHPDWKEVTHPDNQSGSREFENTKTGERIRFDKGKPGETGHEAKDHYHRYNPKAPKGKPGNNVRYLDKEGNPVPKGHDDSHLYPPEGITWD